MTQPGIWKHWKTGNLYRVLFCAREATNGPREGTRTVVYLDLRYGGIHTRAEDQWHERVWLEAGDFTRQRGDTVVNWDELSESTRQQATAARFTFVGTMGNEMTDADAAALYADLHATFTGREV